MLRWLDRVTLGLMVFSGACNALSATEHTIAIPDDPTFFVLIATGQVAMAVFNVWLGHRAWRRLADRRQADRMNVRVLRDGQVLPVTLHRLGKQNGLTVWAIMAPELEYGDTVTADELPAHTALWGAGRGEPWEDIG